MGGIETQRTVVVDAGEPSDHHDFPGDRGVGRIEATRTIDGKVDMGAHV